MAGEYGKGCQETVPPLAANLVRAYHWAGWLRSQNVQVGRKWMEKGPIMHEQPPFFALEIF